MFHNADVEEEVFVKMAPGYEELDESDVFEERVWSSLEPIEMLGDDGRKSGEDRF